MKQVFVFLAAILLVCPCNSKPEGYGSTLMSMLTGAVAGREPKQGLEVEPDEKETSLLETLNLSYAGNMDFSRALDQVD